MFELERLPKERYAFKVGSKGERKEIGQAEFDKLYSASVTLGRLDIKPALEIYWGLSALRMDPKLIKCRVVGGMVVQQVYEPQQLELPPEGEDEQA